jgi:hypothetical protein
VWDGEPLKPTAQHLRLMLARWRRPGYAVGFACRIRKENAVEQRQASAPPPSSSSPPPAAAAAAAAMTTHGRLPGGSSAR